MTIASQTFRFTSDNPLSYDRLKAGLQGLLSAAHGRRRMAVRTSAMPLDRADQIRFYAAELCDSEPVLAHALYAQANEVQCLRA